MDENKNQDWMSIFNDPLNQNNNGGNATSEEGKTEIQNTSSQTVGMGQPVPEGGVVPPQIPASNLDSSAQQSQNSSVNTGIQTNFRPEQTGVLNQTTINQGTTMSDSVSVANSSVQGIPELGEVKQQGMEPTPAPQPQPTPPVPSLQSDVQKMDPFPKEAPVTVSVQGQTEGIVTSPEPSLQQGIPELEVSGTQATGIPNNGQQPQVFQGIAELGEVKQQGIEPTPVPQPQPTPPVPSLQPDVQKIDPFPKEAPATVSTQGQPEGIVTSPEPSLQQGIPELEVPETQATEILNNGQQPQAFQGIPELGEVKQQGMEQTPVPQPQPTPPVPSLQSDVQKIDPFPKEAPATVSTQGQIEGMTATTRPSLQQGIPEVVPVPQAFPTPQPTPMPEQPIQPVQEVIPTTNSSQQGVVGQISNNPGIEEPKKTNFPHYENSPSAEKEQKKLRKLMDRPNTRIRRRHRLLLPMIIFLLIVCIGGYFTLNSYGVFGGSSLTCTRTSTAGNVEESLEYQFSFENNKLKSISYQGEYQLLDTASDIERYNFESNKNGVELLSNTYSSLSGVTYTPEISDRYYQIDVTLDLNKTDTQTNITLSGFEDRLSLDTTRKDVLDVVGRERYVCE